MPSLEPTIFEKIRQKNIYLEYPTFVETGTYMGDTILAMSKLFSELHTIEIKKLYYINAKNKIKKSNINFYLGNSSTEIINICKNINTNTVFFLDGHWSAGDTGRGTKDCPLYEELDGIMKNLKHKSIIIIDDVRLFGKGPKYSNEVVNFEDINIDKILEIVNSRLESYYFLGSVLCQKDRFILHLDGQ
jgi:hypothetical protein